MPRCAQSVPDLRQATSHASEVYQEAAAFATSFFTKVSRSLGRKAL